MGLAADGTAQQFATISLERREENRSGAPHPICPDWKGVGMQWLDLGVMREELATG